MHNGAVSGEGRFQDHVQYLAEFLDEVWVLCDRCGTRGVVRNAQPRSSTSPSFACGSCALSVSGQNATWFGPIRGVAERQCARCGQQVSRVIDGRSRPLKVDVHCKCGAVSSAGVRWESVGDERPRDPTFGLELVLHSPCEGHTLWAYNPGHLEFIRSYVSAGLRERKPNHNATLASRLPQWMKQAKSREAILKTIARIESSISQ